MLFLVKMLFLVTLLLLLATLFHLAELVGGGKEFCLVARRGESSTTLAFSSCIAFGIICLIIIMMRVVADYDDPDEEVGETLISMWFVFEFQD